LQIQKVTRSGLGAQAAWKGFSAQTLYIAYRLINDSKGYEYYPEDVEDLLIKHNGHIIEAVQVKNICSELTLSNLSSGKTSRNNEGLFKRMCQLHDLDSSLFSIRIVHFGVLGNELRKLKDKDAAVVDNVRKKLIDIHGLSPEEASWLIDSLVFEKVNAADLQDSIEDQIKQYVPVMAAPKLAQNQLIIYISKLSECKGCISLKVWKDKMKEIGIQISSIDGFFKEYNKSFVCLRDVCLCSDMESIEKEYREGRAAHPSHIRMNLDLVRPYWLEKVQNAIVSKGAVLVKGVSGQGKSTLCYRYLIDNYPEDCVICVRGIISGEQIHNLVTALLALGNNYDGLIVYLEVDPGQTYWALILQELQFRGITIPILISIREEDYVATHINGLSLEYETIELSLLKEEAHQIYDVVNEERLHPVFRTFDDAWSAFGGKGPFLEYIYMLTNNATLTERLTKQIDALLQEKIDDKWIEILYLICYVGRLGFSVDKMMVKTTVNCPDMLAAIRRFKDEYLITDDGCGERLEALHPVRAQIIYDILYNQISIHDCDVVFKAMSCTASSNIRIILLDYFSRHNLDFKDIDYLSRFSFSDWIGFGNTVKVMIWLDARRYAEHNLEYISNLAEKHGSGWMPFLPLDPSGIQQPKRIAIEGIIDSFPNNEGLIDTIEEVKQKLTSLSIPFEVTTCFLANSTYPQVLPKNSEDCSQMGYVLFWMGKLGFEVELPFCSSELAHSVYNRDIQSAADAIRGLFEHNTLKEAHHETAAMLLNRIIIEMKVISFMVSDDEVKCIFVPPIYKTHSVPEGAGGFNHFWRMRMLSILQQMYPEKEVITVELKGVDLLDEFGIQALDNIIRASKRNRTISWVAETNSWFRIKIENGMRPETWNQYVEVVDAIRQCIINISDNVIRWIDDIYVKGHTSRARLEQVRGALRSFKDLTFKDILLPVAAIDKYGLFSEQNKNNDKTFEAFLEGRLASLEKYKCFTNTYRDVRSCFSQFCNTFEKMLVLRFDNKVVNEEKQSGLSLVNLYAAIKSLPTFQREYNDLFSKYSTLEKQFDVRERESLLTLLNVWKYVMDHPAKGISIAYTAKEQYKKGKDYFKNTIEKAEHKVGNCIRTENSVYFVEEGERTGDDIIKQGYVNVILHLRDCFKNAIPCASNRWYVETQGKKLVYLFVVSHTAIPMAFSIPYYKLFSADDSKIANTLFPCDIEPEVLRKIISKPGQADWFHMFEKISGIRMFLKHVYQVVSVPFDRRCAGGWSALTELYIERLNELWSDYLHYEYLVNQLLEDANEENRESLEIVKSSFGWREEIITLIRERNDLQVALQAIAATIGVILSTTLEN